MNELETARISDDFWKLADAIKNNPLTATESDLRQLGELAGITDKAVLYRLVTTCGIVTKRQILETVKTHAETLLYWVERA